MTSLPDISIVIETLNYERGNAHLLLEVIESLNKQTIAREAIEIILVIDPDENAQLADEVAEIDPAIISLSAPNAHYYAQKNAGAKIAKAPIIGFIDSDCTPVATWVETTIHHLSTQGEKLAGIQGTVVTDRSIQGLAFAVTSFAQVQGQSARSTKMLTGNNCAFRREEFIAEPFEESPWFHGPEVKKISALIQSGRSVLLEPKAQVKHAFYPGVGNFMAFSVYWGWCFLHLRRGEPLGVAYGRLFNRLGWAAPFVLAPAKLVMDTYRILQQRSNMQLTFGQVLRCTALLYCMAPAVGYGALLERLGKEPAVPLY